ncbi:MAG: DUF1579 domain-containing protein [Planctomycetota bacterium]
MSQEMEFPQPTAEHNQLREHAGVWKVHSTFYMDPDPSTPPMEVEAKETIEMFGSFWTHSVYESDFMGQPFQGRATLGYDPEQKEYVSTWIDTMSPTYFQFRGNFEGDTLVMKGRAFDCMSKMEANYRTTELHKSPDERVFEMFMEMPDGNEFKMMTHVYTRA